jgi:hypothetical protein
MTVDEDFEETRHGDCGEASVMDQVPFSQQQLLQGSQTTEGHFGILLLWAREALIASRNSQQ